MMIPLFHLDINIKLLALPNLSVLFQIRYTRNTRAAKDTCFATLVYCWKEHFELPNGALFSCKSHSCIMLYHSPGKHDIPPENECQLPNLPTTLEGLFHVSSQEGIYHFDSSMVQPPFILRSIGHNRVGSC